MPGVEKLVFWWSWCWETVLIMELIRILLMSMVVFRICGVGERTREGNDLWCEMKESGVLDKTTLVFGQIMNHQGQNESGFIWFNHGRIFPGCSWTRCSLFIDNILDLQAGSEVSALLGRMPSA